MQPTLYAALKHIQVIVVVPIESIDELVREQRFKLGGLALPVKVEDLQTFFPSNCL